MKRQKKRYSKPRRPFDKIRIEDENVLMNRYGLKNKREIWKADASISRIRNQAKRLITESPEEKNRFIERLQKRGFKVNAIADALALNKEDLLKRRLQTIVNIKKLANTVKQARQLITHKHIRIGDQVVNIPSYNVSLEEEPLVKTDIVMKKKNEKKDKIEEIKDSVLEQKESEDLNKGKKSDD